LQALPKAQAAMLALQFVQNKIRYVSRSFGSNAYHSHHPDEVLQNRYGDCKDNSLLLLLLSAG
jgi:transglutaminase-like putative cysteine protease